MPSHAQLRRCYLYYNRKWFNGELPLDTQLVWEPVRNADMAFTDKNEDGTFKITMDPAMQAWPKFWRLTLFHEMLHVKRWRLNCKKKKFYDEEIVPLAVRGAFRGLL